MKIWNFGDRVVITREADKDAGKYGTVKGIWTSSDSSEYKGFNLYEVMVDGTWDHEFYFQDELEILEEE